MKARYRATPNNLPVKLTCCLVLSLGLAAIAMADERPSTVSVAHRQLADLGGEHLAHAVYRQTASGGTIVAWGERVIEWPLKRADLREVVPRSGDMHYSNGGCAVDVDGDGFDEIIVARGRSPSCAARFEVSPPESKLRDCHTLSRETDLWRIIGPVASGWQAISAVAAPCRRSHAGFILRQHSAGIDLSAHW